MNLKARTFSMAAVLAVFLLPLFLAGSAQAGVTWLPNGVAAGAYPTGGTDTRTRLTGTAQTYVRIPMDSVKQGATSVLNPSLTPQATVVYSAQGPLQTGFSQNFGAAAANISFTVSVDVPQNYDSTVQPALQALVIYDTADTAVRLTAGVTNDMATLPGTQTAGTSTYPGALAGTPTWVSLPCVVSCVAGDHLVYQVVKTAGSTAIVSVLAMRWQYKPWAVIP